MNLAAMRAQVAAKLDYAPGNERYLREIDAFLNQAQAELAGDKRWNFAQNETRLVAYADRTATDAVVTSGSTTVTTTASFFTPEMVAGAVLHGPDGLDYAIIRRTSATSIEITPAYRGTTTSPATVRVIWRTVRMPADCQSILQLGHRPLSGGELHGRFFPLARVEDEWANLDLDETGEPVTWIRADDTHVMAPTKAPTLATAAGSWAAGTYEFAYAYLYRSAMSTLSPSATVTLDGTTMPQITVPNTGANSGYYKVIFVRPTSTGTAITPLRAFRAYGLTMDETTVTVNLGTAVGDTIERQDRAAEHSGRYQEIRLHPRPATDTTITVRYRLRLPLLLEDQDESLVPAEHHQIIVTKALVEAYEKHDQPAQARAAQEKVDRQTARMAAVELPLEARRLVKGDFDVGCGIRRPYSPRITWTG